MFKRRHKGRVYLDHAAATPVRMSVLRAMQPYWQEVYGNASAVHAEGVRARRAIEDARERLARALGIRSEHVTYTSGGTEANNLALFGYLETLADEGVAYSDMEVVSVPTEHPSILESLRAIEKRGARVHYVDVDEDGCVDMRAFKDVLTPKTRLVTVAYANSETGVVQDLKRISRAVRLYNKEHDTSIRVHTDAAQAPLWLPCRLDALGVDMLTLDTGKCYGPKGLGVLMRRHTVSLTSQTYGGPQESGLRAGTENTPLIIGGTLALLEAFEGREIRAEAIAHMRDEALAGIEEAIPEAVLNGSRDERLPNNINISLPGFDTEYITIMLDTAGIAVSTRSACGAAGSHGSHVVRAMTGDDARANSTLRITLGEHTTSHEMRRTLRELIAACERMRPYKDAG